MTPKPLMLLLAALLTTLCVVAPAADAKTKRIPIRVGISDQNTAMFDQEPFQDLNIKRVRYFVPWNIMEDKPGRLRARAYVKAARKNHTQVLLHLGTDNYASKKGHLPSVKEYKKAIHRLVPYFRHLGVRDFGTWNEANHASQPTYRSPTRAADFFREMYRTVKGRCRGCGVVALDVLDQRGVEKYMKTFFRHLSPTFRHRATIVGLHNYGDVNRKRTKYTRAMIQMAHHYNKTARIWLTETGGLVNFGKSFPYSETRAAHRLSTMFSIANRYRHHHGVDRIYVYNWTGVSPDARFDAGLTDPDGTPRKGYDYLKKKLVRYLR